MKKVLIVLAVLLLLPILLITFSLVFSALVGYGFFENYSGWERVEVPTETEIKATVKLPKDWNFVIDEDRVYIKDENDNVIATEIYEDYRKTYRKDGVDYDNIEEIDVNKNLCELLQQYTGENSVYVDGGGCLLYDCNFGDNGNKYIFVINVLISEQGNYQLVLLIEDEYADSGLFKKIDKSHRYPKDFFQK